MFVDSLFQAALTPLLPHYVAQLGLSKTGAGILTGALPAGALLGSLQGGWLAARAGARRTLALGLAVMCGAGLTFAFGQTIAVLDLSRLLMGAGSACSWIGAMGWLVSATPPDVRGATIGRAMSAAVVGFLLGPVLGAVARETGPQLPFASIALALGALGVATRRFENPPRTEAVGEPWLPALRDTRIRLGAWLLATCALALGALELLAPLRLDALGAGSAAIAATFLAAAAIEGVAQLRVGEMADRRGRIAPIRIGLLAMLGSLLLLPLPRTAALLAVLVVLAWAACGVLHTPAMTLLSDGVEARGLEQGVGFALGYFVSAGGQGIGAIAGGLLAAHASDGATYAVLAALCALTLAALARRERRRAVVRGGGGAGGPRD